MSTDETGLGATIRAWRNRLTPADVGLPSGRARRAVGLRREELAELAGVSPSRVSTRCIPGGMWSLMVPSCGACRPASRYR